MKNIQASLALFLAFGCVGLWAQSSPRGVVTVNGKRSVLLLKTSPKKFTPADRTHTGLVTIYSNLGTGTSVYDAISGTGILGRNVPNQPFPEWVANGFVPTADHTVTEVQVGVTYVEGPNSVIVSLNQDDNGIPGKPLHTWMFSNLPDFGTCCTLQTGMLKSGIPVTQGTMYWVVVRTTGSNQGTWQVWNNDIGGQQGSFSNNLGFGWNSSIQQLGGLGVFGQ